MRTPWLVLVLGLTVACRPECEHTGFEMMTATPRVFDWVVTDGIEEEEFVDPVVSVDGAMLRIVYKQGDGSTVTVDYEVMQAPS